MSLINDALKRAKQAQQQAPLPPSDGPQLRPADADHNIRHGIGLALPVALALLALLALFLAWQVMHRSATPVAARTSPAEPSAQTPSSAQPATSVAVAQPAMNAQPASVAATTSETATPKSEVASTDSTPAVAIKAVNEAAPDNSAATVPAKPPVAVTPPAPAPLKLQAIVFNPSRPSALVNGKTLFLGERIGQFRLVAVTQDTATLASLTATNVLALEE